MMIIHPLPALYVWCARDDETLPPAEASFVEQE